MSEPKRQRIVVGVDGSPASVDALRWAIAQAKVTGATVAAVQSWQIPVAYGAAILVLPGDEFRAAAERSLHEALAHVADEAAGGELDGLIVEGHPAKSLLEQAEQSTLLVVGSRGHGGVVGSLLGSVSQYCINHATVPVVVVRHTH